MLIYSDVKNNSRSKSEIKEIETSPQITKQQSKSDLKSKKTVKK